MLQRPGSEFLKERDLSRFQFAAVERDSLGHPKAVLLSLRNAARQFVSRGHVGGRLGRCMAQSQDL